MDAGHVKRLHNWPPQGVGVAQGAVTAPANGASCFMAQFHLPAKPGSGRRGDTSAWAVRRRSHNLRSERPCAAADNMGVFDLNS